MKISLYYPHSMLHNCSSFKILSRFTEFWGDLFPQKYTEKELVEKIETKIHRFRVPVPAAVNTGRLPLTREKRVGYRVEWLRHYHIWEIMVAFLKLRGKYVRLPVPVGRNGVS